MILGLLDLDLKESWHSDFEDLVYGQEVCHRVEARLDSADMQDISFLSQLTCANDYLKDNLAQSLRQNGVVGYHGCRPKDPTSYTE